jgi:hypothetical protein
MSKTLQELTAHFPAKWDEITIRATKEQFIIKKCDEIVHDGSSKFTERNKNCSIFLDESVVYSMNFQVVCEPREFISYDIQYNSDITFCLREFKVPSFNSIITKSIRLVFIRFSGFTQSTNDHAFRHSWTVDIHFQRIF